MNSIKINKRVIGEGYPTYIIAEIGINHNGILETARRMIDKAKECGVDCVKFQKRYLPLIYDKQTLENPHLESISLGIYIPILKEIEFTIEEHKSLKDYCKKINIDYLCSPWDSKSASELESIGVDAYKIPSINLTNMRLIRQIMKYEKPIIFSTGMSNWRDIVDVDALLSYDNADYIFLHCVSTYPVDFKDCNLKMIEVLARMHKPVGYSGHERGIEISVCAAAMGASVIERHFTLDRTQKGPDHACSLEPEGLKRMCEHIRMFELAKGDGEKRITRGEQIVKEALGKNPIETKFHIDGGANCSGDSNHAFTI